MKELLALPLAYLFQLLGKTQARGKILFQWKGYVLAEFERQTVPCWLHPVCTHPSLEREGCTFLEEKLMQQDSHLKEPRHLLLSGTFLNSDSLARKFFFFINSPLLALCYDYCIFVVVAELTGSESQAVAAVVVYSPKRCHACASSHTFKQCPSPVFSSPVATVSFSGKFSLWVPFSLRFCCCTCKTRA